MLDDIDGSGYNSGAYNGSFDGTETRFRLKVSGAVITPSIASIFISLDGVLQEHTAAYSVSGNDIIFTEAPASSTDFFGYLMGVSSYIDTDSVGANELDISGNGSQGQSLISDGDGSFTWSNITETTLSDDDNDTKIQTEESADEDVIRFDIAGSEKMVLNSTGLAITGNLDVTGVTTETSLTASDSMVINNAGSDVGLKVNSTSTGHIMQLQDNASDVFVVQDGGGVNIAGTFKIGDVAVTSTAAEINILDGVTSTTAEINILDGVTSSTAELNILDGVTATAAEINILDGVTSTAAELNILDGVTSTAAELNIMDGVTADKDEINILDGVTSTTAELNILDGVTSTAAEINLLDGVSGLVQADFTKLAAVDSTAAELNIVDGGTSATSTTLADADRVVVNDNGTMVQVALTDFETYFESALDTLNSVTSASSLATVGTIGTGTWEGTTIAVDQGGTGEVTLAAYRTSLFGASDLPVTHGGTGASTAGTARTNLGVDAAGTDNSTDVTLAGTPDYITISGQVITRGTIDIGDDTNLVAGTGITLTDDTLSIDAAQTQITSLGTITTFRSTGIDDNADALAITIDSSERVGIVTTAPDYKFETEVDSTSSHLASVGMTTQGSYGSNLVFKADNVGETVELRASTASGGGQLDIFTKTTGGTATQRLRIDNAGKVTIAGDLEVQGATTTVDTATLTIEDPIFQLASGQTSPSADAGFIVKRYSSPSSSNYNVGLIWDEGTDTFEFANTYEAAADTDITIQSHTIVKTGNLLPGTDATYDLGSSSLQWNNVYMADLNLNNETRGGNEVDGTTGQWTIQEGQEDLFLINRRSGKKYKFNLTEVI